MSEPIDLSRFDSLEAGHKKLIEQLMSLYPQAQQRILFETLQLIGEEFPLADMKMMSKVIHEIRTGLEVFAPYRAWRKVTLFGSARIAAEDERYHQVYRCGRALRDAGFMVITGGGGGLMHAANEGAGFEQSFGININLPMEQKPNPIVEDSPRHFYCQYFFTRKLFFLKESDAVILAPGGFGTLDEAFETLTLLQTGRNPPIPVVLLEAPGDDYWGPLLRSWVRRLVDDGLVSAEDTQVLFHTDNVEAAVTHIKSFYTNYHSFRYVGEWMVLRLLNPLSEAAMESLNAEFSDVLHEGVIEQIYNWPKSDDESFAHLPRLRLRMNPHRMNVLPQLIRRMNALSESSSGHS